MTLLELRSADVGERYFLPLGRGEIPIASAGFVIVPAGAVRNSRREPVVHSHLQQCTGRNSDPGSNRTALESAQGQCSARRWAPEMPNAISALSHTQHRRVRCGIKVQGHGIMCVRAKPWLAPVESSLNLAAVIIEDNLFAVDPARQPGPGHFNQRRFAARHSRVRDRDAPEPRRSKPGRPRDWIHISRFVTHFIRNARIVQYDKRRPATTSSFAA